MRILEEAAAEKARIIEEASVGRLRILEEAAMEKTRILEEGKASCVASGTVAHPCITVMYFALLHPSCCDAHL